MVASKENQLGAYLKDRRSKLNAAALGFPTARRRTPGLRREEVAQRANVSATWYTWLEQGRGGAPSADVIDRIAYANKRADSTYEYTVAPVDQWTPRASKKNRTKPKGFGSH